MTTYFYVITIHTGLQPASVANLLHAAAESTAQMRYEAIYKGACDAIRGSGIDVPDGAPVVFYRCEPN